MMLPAFAAERRRLLHTARSKCTHTCRSISPVRKAHGGKTRRSPLLQRSMGQTDGQSDGRTDAASLHRLCPAYPAGSINDISHPVTSTQSNLHRSMHRHRFHSPQPNTSLYYKLRGYGSGRCIMWFAAFAYCAYT